MTTLNPTSRIVVMNSTLSDLSFLAIYKAELPIARNIVRTKIAVSGQQSSVGGVEAPASRFGANRVPSSQSSSAHRPMTAHSSQQFPNFLLEHPSALRVIAEHVEARACR